MNHYSRLANPSAYIKYWLLAMLISLVAFTSPHTLANHGPLGKGIQALDALTPEEVNSYHDVSQYFRSIKSHIPINDKIAFLARYFDQRPYEFDSLGDGPEGDFDIRPLVKTSSFDCMTYVTTIIAILHSQRAQDFLNRILDIRYIHGRPGYFQRHHFISSEWNPINQIKGYLQDVTHQCSPDNKHTIHTTISNDINYPEWLQFQKKLLLRHKLSKAQLALIHARQAQAKVRPTRLTHIPIERLFTANGQINTRILDNIPSASIIEFTCPNRKLKALIGTQINVCHLGLLFRKNGVLYLNHASIDAKKIITQPLADYLLHIKHKVLFLRGIHIERILDRRG